MGRCLQIYGKSRQSLPVSSSTYKSLGNYKLLPNPCALSMNLTLVGGELAEYSKEQLFWDFRFLSAVLRVTFLKPKRIVEEEDRYGHDRTEQIGCAVTEI